MIFDPAHGRRSWTSVARLPMWRSTRSTSWICIRRALLALLLVLSLLRTLSGNAVLWLHGATAAGACAVLVVPHAWLARADSPAKLSGLPPFRGSLWFYGATNQRLHYPLFALVLTAPMFFSFCHIYPHAAVR